jgi:hypothetical protein
MDGPRRQSPETAGSDDPDAPAAEAERRASEWWWAGRLMALHGFSARHCPYRRAGEPRRHWLAGFASGTRTVAARPPRAA